MPAVRRLAAILAADVAGYSRLMGADEEGTHERVKAHLAELVEPKIGEHRGRVVKNTGDGVLAEFASVVDAVRCAAEIQRGMLYRELEVPDERRIRFRIGVNLGDVIAEEDDIFGDGVNVAARLEALAEPGGVCVSRMVRDNVRDKVDYTFEDLGEQQVKNIARPVRAYALPPERVPASRPLSRSSTTSSPPPVAPRLSIVVLPFANLSNDPERQYFADGITEDLTTNLSRIPGMLVISRNTAFTYQGRRVDTKQIGRELGVRYVLEGSARRLGNQIRINAQLIDAETDAHLWAERFDGDTADLFALQDEVTSRIAFALNVEVTMAEAARPVQSPDALDHVLRGRAVLYRPASLENYAEAINSFEQALELDPQSTDAQLGLVQVLVSRIVNFGSKSAAEDIKRAEALANRALAAAPHSAYAHYANTEVLRVQRRCADAILEYETVLALDHNAVRALANKGRCKIYVGPIAESVPLLEQAIRLSPRDPQIGIWYWRIGEAHLLQSHIDEAILWLEKARIANVALLFVHAYLAAAYALKGEGERATAELAQARSLGSWQSVHRVRAGGRYETPEIRALAEATLIEGLRKAGMPEE